MTGSIAKELWTSESPTPERGIVVQVECSATDFVNNAFERFRFDPFRRRKHHRTKRRGRIDIAVLQFGKLLSFKSVVGIELKGFNPPEKNIRSDLARLIHAMEETDPVGENSIVASFLAFIMSLKKKKEMLNARDVEPRIRNLQNKVERSLDGILTDGNGLQKNIYIWRIDVDGSDEVAQRMPEDVRDQNDIASETRAVVGVLVTITRKVT